jgi:hypothetical protein
MIFIAAIAVGMTMSPCLLAAQDGPASVPLPGNHAKIESKLKSIIIDKVNFDKADVATVIDFLSRKSKSLDPDKEGVNIVLRLPDDNAKDAAPATPRPKIHREVSITLENVPLGDLLEYISQQTNLQYSIEEYAVVLHPIN